MVKRAGLVLLVMIGVACGGSDKERFPGTDGVINSDASCADGVGFGVSHLYNVTRVCTLADGSVGADVEVGRYSISATKLTTVASVATCPDTTTK